MNHKGEWLARGESRTPGSVIRRVSIALAGRLLLPLAVSPAGAAGEFAPRLHRLSVSTSATFDHWAGTGAGNGFGWKKKNNIINPPQSLYWAGLGTVLSLGSAVRAGVNVQFHYSRIESYTEPQFPDSPTPGQSALGMGDVDVFLGRRLEPANLGLRLVVPGPYDPEYGNPWEGFGVWRLGMEAALAAGPYYFWTSPEVVLYRPESGMAQPGDWLVKAGMLGTFRLSGLLGCKPEVELEYSRIRWVAGVEPMGLFKLTPAWTLSLSDAWKRELSLGLGATGWSYQSGGTLDGAEFLNIYAPRKIFIRLGANLYL